MLAFTPATHPLTMTGPTEDAFALSDLNHANLRLPWDDAERRPSHANRRKGLSRLIMPNELSTIAAARHLPRKIIQLAE